MTLRDFNAPSGERSIILTHEPVGNGAGLSGFHTVSPEAREPNNTGKIVGALAVALMVGAGGLYAYTATGNHPKPMTTAANLPATPPAQPAAMTAPAPEALTPLEAAPVIAPAAAPAPAASPAPMRSAAVRPAPAISDGASVRMNADAQATTPVPAAPIQQAEITPVLPTPSPSDLAVANPQSIVAVPPNAVTAQAMPAQAAEPAAQPQDASPAQAEPAQSAGQVSQ